jgi:hypothetical protein
MLPDVRRNVAEVDSIYIPGNYRKDMLLEQKDSDNEHVWVAAALYKVTADNLRRCINAVTGKVESVDTVYLDMENLVGVEVGCYVCERPFSEWLSRRKCEGEPL